MNSHTQDPQSPLRLTMCVVLFRTCTLVCPGGKEEGREGAEGRKKEGRERDEEKRKAGGRKKKGRLGELSVSAGVLPQTLLP